MSAELGLIVLEGCAVDRFARIGAALASGVSEPGAGPVLVVAGLAGDAILLGRFQRARSAIALDHAADLAIYRRLGGGRSLRVGEGTVGVLLAVPARGLSEPVSPGKFLNRMVRGLRRGLESSRLARSVHYFGRDFLSSGGKQVAILSQEGTASGAAVLEAVVASRRVLSIDGELSAYPEHSDVRALGPPHATLVEVGGADPGLEALAEAIGRGYADVNQCELVRRSEAPAEGETPRPDVVEDESGWERSGVADVPIGFVEALVRHEGARVLGARLRGDFIAPAFVIRELEQSIVGAALSFDELGRRVDAAFRAPGAFLHGVTRLRVFADAIRAAAGEH
jgi:hypothetical protein